MAPGIPYNDSNDVSVASSRNDSLNSYTAELYDSNLEHDILEPIAVVGFSLRFPQEATSPESFWEMLAEKRCAMTEWPKDRINLDAFYHPDSNRTDTVRALPMAKPSSKFSDCSLYFIDTSTRRSFSWGGSRRFRCSFLLYHFRRSSVDGSPTAWSSRNCLSSSWEW